MELLRIGKPPSAGRDLRPLLRAFLRQRRWAAEAASSSRSRPPGPSSPARRSDSGIDAGFSRTATRTCRPPSSRTAAAWL